MSRAYHTKNDNDKINSSISRPNIINPFLKEIGCIELLTREQEQDLAKTVQCETPRAYSLMISSETLPFAEWYARQIADKSKKYHALFKTYEDQQQASNGSNETHGLEDKINHKVHYLQEFYQKSRTMEWFIYYIGAYLGKEAIWEGIDEVRKKYMCLFPAEPEFEQAKSALNKAYCTVQAESSAACTNLLNANLRLVVSTAKKYTGRGVPLADLVQEGCIGLMTAARKFDYFYGYKFSTYSIRWVRQAITRAIEYQQHPIHIPVYVIELHTKAWYRFKNEEHRLGRQLTKQEQYQVLCASFGERQAIKFFESKGLLHIASLNTPLSDDGDRTIATQYPDPEPHESSHEAAELLEVFETELAGLTARQEKVIRMRYGIGQPRQYSLEEIGDVFDLTRERIRQIEGLALRRLQQRKHRLKDLL